MPGRTHTIVVVDDEPLVADVLTKVLKASFAKHNVKTFTSALEAAAFIRDNNVALVLCDLQMPDLDGASLLAEVYISDPMTVSVMITGRATKDGLMRAINEGHVWKCIEKPWRMEEICAIISDALRLYESRLAVRMTSESYEKYGSDAISAKRILTFKPKIKSQAGKRRARRRLKLERAASKDGLAGMIPSRRSAETPYRPVKKKFVFKQPAERDEESGILVARPIGAPPTEEAPKKLKIRLPAGSGGNRGVRAGRRIYLNRPAPSPKKFKLVQRGAVSDPRAVIEGKRYANLSLVGEGGFSSVYKADDLLLRMPVAIKVIAEHLTANPDAIATLINEAKLAMQLSHKNIVRLHNIERVGAIVYMVMEYIDGPTLRTVMDESGAFSAHTVVQIIDICEDAMTYAHHRQIYHRDLKPDNLMLTGENVLKIIDFGVACLAAESLKHKDEIQGTPFYMSPEEVHGGGFDQRADIYSIGVMVHEFLTGVLPPHSDYTEPSLFDYIPVAAQDLPEAVRGVLNKSFETEPNRRWQSFTEFAINLRHALSHSGM